MSFAAVTPGTGRVCAFRIPPVHGKIGITSQWVGFVVTSPQTSQLNSGSVVIAQFTVTPGERDPEKRESWDLHSYVIGDVVNDRSLIRDENYRTCTKRLQEASRFIPESLRALLHAESCSGEQRLPDLFALGLTQASSHERFPSHSAMRMESGQLIRCKAPVVRYLYGRNFSAITNYGFLGRPGFATA